MTGPSVLVVGDGIVAHAIAFELIEAGAEITMIGHEEPGAAWSAAAGKLTPSSEVEHLDADLADAMRAALRIWPDFQQRLESRSAREIARTEAGALFVALEADHRRELARLKAMHDDLGIVTRAIDVDAMREAEPGLSPRQLGGLIAPSEGAVEPQAVREAVRAVMKSSGATMLSREEVRELDLTATTPRLEHTKGGTHTFDRAVLAAGVWSRDHAPEALAELRPVKGQYAVLEGEEVVRHVIHTPEVYLVPRPGGRLYVGASMEEVGFTPGCTPREMTRLFHEAWRVVPDVQELRIVETGYGYRPAIRSHAPRHERLGPSAYVTAGHFRHGILLAPWTATIVRDLVLGG